jgi:hypothetical protein
MAPKRIPISIRIMAKVSKEGGACWLWNGSCSKDGYGVMGVGRSQKRAHRMAYECFVGEIPDGMLVCHTCDVPKCVNPDHLFLGNRTDNMKDCATKRRVCTIGKSNSAMALHMLPTKVAPRAFRSKWSMARSC